MPTLRRLIEMEINEHGLPDCGQDILTSWLVKMVDGGEDEVKELTADQIQVITEAVHEYLAVWDKITTMGGTAFASSVPAEYVLTEQGKWLDSFLTTKRGH